MTDDNTDTDTVIELARQGDIEALTGYLDAGVPVDLTNDRGDTMIMLAAYHGQRDVVELLLARGADPNRANDHGQAPLAGAVFKGETEIVQTLVAAGADPDAGTPSARNAAAMFGKTELLKLFDAN